MEKLRILIVDDTPANLKTLAAMLKETYRITFAKNGEEALDLMKKCALPDLIILDVMMPGINGYDLCRKLKEDDSTKEIPVIFITAKTEQDDRQKGFDAGAVDYISKPFDASTVKQIVKSHLWLSRG
jgi:putative two-component system response regulator